MEKLKMHSPDLQQDNIARIRTLFPGCVTEATDDSGKVRLRVDFDQLRQELSDHLVEGPHERYRLDWPGKRQALATANAPIAKTLRPYREESVDFDASRNLFIEGDNLDALRILQDTYLGSIKMIYIDPPYNTGNDFLYNDDFRESSEEYFLRSNQRDEAGNTLVANTEANGRFHSDWLCMMYPRLRLARNLLRDDGVIFISIDDNEAHNLRKICDEIFGAENFVCTFVRRRRMATGMRDTAVSPDHEYVVAFAKNISQVKLYGFARKESDFPFSDEKSAYRSTDLTVGMTKEMRPNQYYAIRHPTYGTEYLPPDERVWRFEPKTMEQQIKDENIIWPDDNPNGRMTRPRFKTRYFEGEEKLNPISSWIQTKTDGAQEGESNGLAAGLNQEGTKELRDLFGSQLLEYPKPLSLLRGLIQIATRNGDIVLDFFAGSGTTGHAVLETNQLDKNIRRFILVQLPEASEKSGYSTIAEVTKERVRRAGQKLKSENVDAEGLDVGFRVLKIDTSNMQDVYYRPDEVDQRDLLHAVDNIKPDRTPEDLLFQVLVDWGVDLTLPIRRETVQGKTVFFVDENALVACFDLGVTEELVKELAGREPLRVVFRDNGFVSDAVKINVEQVFRQLSPGTDVKSI
ncbi:MAG: site-specific DNA-methyltransferase [Methylobacterium sp.]|nr:MAG: site-specific DNA-methyltransferase [Methylobacterium sp.]